MSSNHVYRAEHVGSLLRPAELVQARESWKAGNLSIEELHGIENECIRQVVAMQENLGLRCVTDGEFRRESYQVDFIRALEGIELGGPTDTNLYFTNPKLGTPGIPVPKIMVTGRIKAPKNGIFVEGFKFLKTLMHTAEAKVCIPGPAGLHYTVGQANISRDVYPTSDRFWKDVVAAYSAEIRSLADAGCRFIQIDETSIPKLGDLNIQQTLKDRGEDWRELMSNYAAATKQVVASAPAGVTIALHHCRGNNRGMWQAECSYEPSASALFQQIRATAYFLEFDTPRAGDFTPLRHMRDDARVVLGLISTKERALEQADDIKRRVDEASQLISLDRLSLSPQCGFSSGYTGHPLSHDDQRRKLELLVRVAEDIWGTS